MPRHSQWHSRLEKAPGRPPTQVSCRPHGCVPVTVFPVLILLAGHSTRLAARALAGQGAADAALVAVSTAIAVVNAIRFRIVAAPRKQA